MSAVVIRNKYLVPGFWEDNPLPVNGPSKELLSEEELKKLIEKRKKNNHEGV